VQTLGNEQKGAESNGLGKPRRATLDKEHQDSLQQCEATELTVKPVDIADRKEAKRVAGAWDDSRVEQEEPKDSSCQ